MNICVFCGSSIGQNRAFAEAARELGRLMAAQSHTLIYGGGKVGLMGVVADAVLESNGEVIGIIPDFLLQREVGHRGLTRLEVVESMHERKYRMANLADAFVAMPGGWGTLDELAEILTWRQLGLINHPVALLNINQFFTPLLEQMQHMANMGFLKENYREHFQIFETPQALLTEIQSQKIQR
ncbi:LOG family protein [Pseudochryseolinea flava]|uniref:Cytokinin riboside 5'-monophosphate phosphoribohydrolase n=1 Tax=Pseudochryseolinea flava TaxID=2059302 RepID=A0A364Y7Z4_9BACT|nr:TIGR00730 family Rossman fold protein [Pseudochryseolinea flava]RAW03201.1 TIGR00730 family Rossman fold protein [Pseudochryseolinea flava]